MGILAKSYGTCMAGVHENHPRLSRAIQLYLHPSGDRGEAGGTSVDGEEPASQTVSRLEQDSTASFLNCSMLINSKQESLSYVQ